MSGTSSSEAANPQVRCMDSKRNAPVRDMEDSHTLLPCPFCGGEAHTIEPARYGKSWGVRCECGAFLGFEHTEAEAIAAWNTRTELENGVERSRTEYTPLTDEQVRKAIFNGSTYASYDGCTYHASGIRPQAIADELNAELGSGTCHIVKTWSDSDYNEDWRYRCSECGCFIDVYERDPETGDVINAANYCPNCGAKVVKE